MKRAKKLTSKSGLTIPKDIRLEAGLYPSMAVDIENTPKGVLITPHRPVCRFCERSESVVKCAGIDICDACAVSLKKELEVKHGIG